MSDEARSLNEKRDELIFDLIKRRFDGEIDRAKNLDSKAASMVGFVSVVIGLILGGNRLLTGADSFNLQLLSSQYASYLYIAGIIVLLVSIGCALVALKVRKWTTVPDVEVLTKKYADSEYIMLIQAVGGTMRESISYSEKRNKNKAMFIEFSWYSLILGLVLIFSSYMFIYSGFHTTS